MSGRAEGASASTGLVDRAPVHTARLEVGRDARFEPDLRQSVVQDLRQRLVQYHELAIPASALYEQTLLQANTHR